MTLNDWYKTVLEEFMEISTWTCREKFSASIELSYTAGFQYPSSTLRSFHVRWYIKYFANAWKKSLCFARFGVFLSKHCWILLLLSSPVWKSYFRMYCSRSYPQSKTILSRFFLKQLFVRKTARTTQVLRCPIAFKNIMWLWNTWKLKILWLARILQSRNCS